MSDASINAPLSHDAAYAELGSLALGALSADDARLVRAHVADCSICATKLEEMERVAVVMPSRTRAGVLSPARSAAIRSRLVARAGESRGVEKPARNYSRLLAIAAAVLLIALSVGYETPSAFNKVFKKILNISPRDFRNFGKDGQRDVIYRLSRPRLEKEIAVNLTQHFEIVSRPIAGEVGPNLVSNGSFELTSVIGGSGWTPSGFFSEGFDYFVDINPATYALQPGDLKAIAITEEPEGGLPAPTGAVILAGTGS